MTSPCRETALGAVHSFRYQWLSKSLPSIFFFNLLLDVLAVGIHLLIPFLNWLPQENQKSEQYLLRRTLSRRELREIGDRIFRTREQSLEDGNQQEAPKEEGLG